MILFVRIVTGGDESDPFETLNKTEWHTFFFKMAANCGAWDDLLMIHCCWICYLSIRLLVRLLRQRREIITYCVRLWLSRTVANKYLFFSESFTLPYGTKRLVHFWFLKYFAVTELTWSFISRYQKHLLFFLPRLK